MENKHPMTTRSKSIIETNEPKTNPKKNLSDEFEELDEHGNLKDFIIYDGDNFKDKLNKEMNGIKSKKNKKKLGKMSKKKDNLIGNLLMNYIIKLQLKLMALDILCILIMNLKYI